MLTKLGINTIIQLFGKLLATLTGLIIVALMTRDLGPVGFGYYTTVIAFLQTFAILVDFGLTMTAGRSLGNQHIPPATLLGNILSFRTVTSAITFSLAPLIALILPYPNIVKVGIAFTSIAFFLASLTQSFQAVFQAALKSSYLVLADFWGRLILLVGTIIVAQMSLGLIAYLFIYNLASLIITLSTLIYAQKIMPFRWELDLAIWRKIWLVTWPLTITIILNLIYLKADTLILAATWPAEYVGQYGVAYKVLEVLLAIPAIIGGLVLPLAAKYHAQKENQKLIQLFHDSFDTLLAAAAAIIIGSFIVGKEIITTLAGYEFITAAKLLLPLSLAAAFIFISYAVGYFIFAIGKQKEIIPLYVITATTALILFFLLIPKYSYWGAAWGAVASNFIMAGGSIFLLTRWGLSPSVHKWPKIIMATTVLAIGLMVPISLIFKLGLGLILYLLTIFYLKLIPIKTAAAVIKEQA